MEKLIAYCGACGEFTICKTINDFLAMVPANFALILPQ